LTVAKRLYLIILGFFSLILGTSNRFILARESGGESLFHRKIPSGCDLSCCNCEKILRLPVFQKITRIDAFAVDP